MMSMYTPDKDLATGYVHQPSETLSSNLVHSLTYYNKSFFRSGSPPKYTPSLRIKGKDR